MVGQDLHAVMEPVEFAEGFIALLAGLAEFVGEIADQCGVGVQEVLEASVVRADLGHVVLELGGLVQGGLDGDREVAQVLEFGLVGAAFANTRAHEPGQDSRSSPTTSSG
ncbi:hypothetical protein ACFLIM_41810 [Nonomuraea sp. M3C6]|uniref:Uncharacterized protein n=1 Tax=Nonomuraea marmarensis TaxID=3351344 RepID=A0ABW7AQP9_9ACTN